MPQALRHSAAMKRWPSQQQAVRRVSIVAATVNTASSTTQTNRNASQMLPPAGPGEVYYFAYGSNMSPSVLTDRRGVKPRASAPCKVPGFALSFNMLGFPYSEPAFASIEQASAGRSAKQEAPPEVHGVVHLISEGEWQKVQRTEGVTDSKELGYQVLPVRALLYSGQEVDAVTLQGTGKSCHPSSRQALPSERYLKLLRTGARHHQVDPSYQAYLDSLRAYDSSSTQSKAGQGASLFTLLLLFGPLLPLLAAFRALAYKQDDSSSQPLSPAWVSAWFNSAVTAAWAVHDSVLVNLFGSGAENGDKQAGKQ